MLAAAGGLAYIDPAAHGGLVHGLKLAAVGVVAWALWGLARRLTPDPRRLAIGLVALACALAIPAIAGQLFALGAGAVLAPWLVPYQEVPRGVRLSVPLGRGGAIAALALFAILLAGLPLLASAGPAAALADAMYRAGALVFGGGHVVLPLLHAQTVVPGLLPADTFLAGYGLAQALPGPLFTFGGFVGAAAGGVAAGLLALVAIFLPGFLLLLAVLPFWQAVRASTRVRRHLAVVNAAVVGVLGAALYDPVLTSGIRHWADVAIAAAVVAGLASGRVPPWLLVLACGLAGWLLY
jgi:chromate transporter